MEVQMPQPIVSVRDLLPTLGFVPMWGTATDQEPAFEYKSGGIDIRLTQVTGLYLRPEFMVGGMAVTARELTYVERSMPLALASREQLVAWLTFAVGANFTTTAPVAWFKEGQGLQHLLPWEQEKLRLQAEREKRARQRLLRPPCTVERHWMRQLLNALNRIVGWPPAPGTFEITFDGEMLEVYARGQVAGVPAQGGSWPARFRGKLLHLHSLPRRLATNPVEVDIWRNELQIERARIPVHSTERDCG